MSEIEDLEKHLAFLNLQREEIHLADLKRQRRELESSGKQIECPECDIKKTNEDEDCPECRVAVGMGMYLKICKELGSEENCQELFEKVNDGEITPEEFFDIIKEKAKDDPENLGILEYTDELIDLEGIGTEGNPKKDVKPEVEPSSNPVIMRKLRPSPSISATSVVVGTVMTGGDGNLWEVKAYKRGDKTIQHWIRYDGAKEPESSVESKPVVKSVPKSKSSDPLYVAHVTDKKSLDKIKKDGYKCRDYFSKHPIGMECTTFFYPLNGVDNQLKFRPQNARMSGEDVDDEVYVIFNIDDDACKVGDLRLEAVEEKYKKTMMPYREYQKGEENRFKFREPEVVCYNSISPEKIVAVLTYSEMKKLFESCPDRNKTECMINSIQLISENTKVPKPKEPEKKVVKPTVNPTPRSRLLRSDRQAFTKDGIPVVGHTWVYGDTVRGYSLKKGGSKPRYMPESYVWDDGFVVDRSDYEDERDARLYAYQDMKRRGWDLEPVSEEQAEVEEEDIEVKVKPKKPVKKVVKPKPPVELEDELSRLKKQEMKYYREEVAAKDYASKIEAYRKRLEVSKKIKRLTRPPRREKPVLTRRQMQLEHEAKQIARIQKLDGRIEKQAQMDVELQVVKKEYDPEEVDGKDPVLFERQVERHRATLKKDIDSLKQDENVSIGDNKIKYDGEYMTYTHRLTEEEFEAIS